MSEFSVTASNGERVNLFWEPVWKGMDPNEVLAHAGEPGYEQFGNDGATGLLPGIAGSSRCLPRFGGSDISAGGCHGDINRGRFKLADHDAEGHMVLTTNLPQTMWGITSSMFFSGDHAAVLVEDESVNQSEQDQKVTYSQHVTMGGIFLDDVVMHMPKNTRGKAYDGRFFTPKNGLVGGSEDYQLLPLGAEFMYPDARMASGTPIDLSRFPKRRQSDCTTQVIDPSELYGWFAGENRTLGILFACVWPRAQFPYLARWVENLARWGAPWNTGGQNGGPNTRALGYEIANTPFPEEFADQLARDPFMGLPTSTLVRPGEILTTRYLMFALPITPGNSFDAISVTDKVNVSFRNEQGNPVEVFLPGMGLIR
ncbi:MAG: hypothetical protein WC527_07030 [Candidatus Margulisiibacteriota bacterium]